VCAIITILCWDIAAWCNDCIESQIEGAIAGVRERLRFLSVSDFDYESRECEHACGENENVFSKCDYVWEEKEKGTPRRPEVCFLVACGSQIKIERQNGL
jgi:hypothetical protein